MKVEKQVLNQSFSSLLPIYEIRGLIDTNRYAIEVCKASEISQCYNYF